MESPRILRFLSALALLVAAPAALAAQTSGKKPLDHDAYDIWRSVGGQALAGNGEWIAFTISPREGDGFLTLRSLGQRNTRAGTVARGDDPRITSDSRFLIFTIEPMHAVVDSLEKADAEEEDMPSDSLAVVDIRSAFASDGSLNPPTFTVDSVRSWQIPAEEGSYLAYLLEREQKPDSAAEGEEEAAGEGPARGRAGGRRPGGAAEEAQEGEGPDRRKAEGYPLVLRILESGEEFRFEDVTSYRLTDDGAWLLYMASNEDGTADGVYAVATSTGEATPVLTGEGVYSDLAVDDGVTQIAFLTNRDDWEADEPAFTLYHAVLGQGEARAVATEGTPRIPEGWWVSDKGPVSFSDGGTRLFFGTAPRPPKEEKDSIPEDERVEVDIWNWKDPLIQPMQLVQADRERERTYLAYASTDDHGVVQLATLDVPEVSTSQISQGGDGEWGLATTNTMVRYGWYVSHDGSYQDVYLLNMATGEKELVLEMFGGRSGPLSPQGRFASFWDGSERDWMVFDATTREIRNLTENLPFPVHNELDDHPDEPGPYGVVGWLENDAALLIRDHFDIWAVDPTGRQAPRNVTEGVGRANDIRFGYVSLDRGRGSNEGIDPREDALLSAFQISTKASGFYRDRFDGSREPQRLVLDDYRFGNPNKAEDAEVFVLTRQSFQEYPDLWVTDPDFRDMEKLSDANPQQEEYLWGSAEIMEWVSNDGIPLQGILVKPEGFDPNHKYPLMVYFYERSSDGLHSYRTPGPGTSVNYSFYVSRGYVFFVPDIPYEIGHPGESAIDAVVPGVLKLVDQGYIDPERIGAQGHSWGGYQLAYMITRTNLFAAVEAGAPVANMTSAYGGIRWDSGMNRQFQYERTQSRIGGSLWEETLRYINNSPLFEADKIRTPLLMIHNDRDGAVPWYQGIEMYMALRRLQKPVWMLNYNGEPHGLRQRPNQEDWTIRMQQFFDHYLKGAPAPVWMLEGVPAVMKGKTMGLELVEGRGGGNGGH